LEFNPNIVSFDITISIPGLKTIGKILESVDGFKIIDLDFLKSTRDFKIIEPGFLKSNLAFKISKQAFLKSTIGFNIIDPSLLTRVDYVLKIYLRHNKS
jgi:hypothetical protein